MSRLDFTSVFARTFGPWVHDLGRATLTLRLELAILTGSQLLRTAKPALSSMDFDSTQPDRQFVVLDDTPCAKYRVRTLQECSMQQDSASH